MAVLALVSLFLTSIIGAVLWIVSTEVQAAAYGAAGWNPFLIGAVCSAGQNVNYVILYIGGTELLERWMWLARQVDRVHERLGRPHGQGLRVLEHRRRADRHAADRGDGRPGPRLSSALAQRAHDHYPLPLYSLHCAGMGRRTHLRMVGHALAL